MPNEILTEVMAIYPQLLLEVFNSCLQEGRFFVDWKKQRLVLLRKGNKPLEDASFYRPICPLVTMGKLRHKHKAERRSRKCQYGLRKGFFGSNRYA